MMKIPLIGQGTWNLGREGIEALRAGIDLGMNHVDTAEMYRNEHIVAEAIEGIRGKVFLASKVLPSNASYKGTLEACERSLKQLRTDYLDLHLLHWWTGAHPISETMRAMEALVKAGKIRYIGVSNLDVDRLQEAQNALKRERLACNQVLYHLRSRGIEHRLIPYCQSQSIAVVGYSPFGQSNFPAHRSAQGRILSTIAAKHGKTERQVALNFLVREKGVYTIPKASSIDHVRENAGAAGWKLDSEDVALIDGAFPLPDVDAPLDTA
jgi:diketogulonate reductase-like aldo/keto reductase